MFAFAITLSELFDLTGTITYFPKRPFVVMLSLSTDNSVYLRNLVDREVWIYIFDFYNIFNIVL